MGCMKLYSLKIFNKNTRSDMRWHALMRTCMTIGMCTNFDDFMFRTPGAIHIAGFALTR